MHKFRNRIDWEDFKYDKRKIALQKHSETHHSSNNRGHNFEVLDLDRLIDQQHDSLSEDSSVNDANAWNRAFYTNLDTISDDINEDFFDSTFSARLDTMTKISGLDGFDSDANETKFHSSTHTRISRRNQKPCKMDEAISRPNAFFEKYPTQFTNPNKRSRETPFMNAFYPNYRRIKRTSRLLFKISRSFALCRNHFDAMQFCRF